MNANFFIYLLCTDDWIQIRRRYFARGIIFVQNLLLQSRQTVQPNVPLSVLLFTEQNSAKRHLRQSAHFHSRQHPPIIHAANWRH